MEAIFEFYSKSAKPKSVAVSMKPGSCSVSNGLTIYEIGANLTNNFRHSMDGDYMPDGAGFNGIQNTISDEQEAKLNIEDILNDDQQKPLILSKAAILS